MAETDFDKNRPAKRSKNPDPSTGEQETPKQPNEEEDSHLGATEDEVSDTPAPAGSAFDDEPKQG